MPPPLEGDTIAAHFSVQASLHVRSGSIRILNGLRDEFAHDMFHLNEAAAFISVEQVARAVDEL
jgi:dolichol kinase